MREIFSILPARGPIPPTFHTECGDGPFETCGACAGALADAVGYSVIKEVQADRCIFEFAICFDCSDELSDAMSDDSREFVIGWMRRGVHPENEQDCFSCGAEAITLVRSSSRILCRGDAWILGPEVCCASCEEELQEGLSAETRGEYEDWFRAHVPGIPSAEIDIEAFIGRL